MHYSDGIISVALVSAENQRPSDSTSGVAYTTCIPDGRVLLESFFSIWPGCKPLGTRGLRLGIE